MLGLGKSSAAASADGIDKPQPRNSWSFRRKLLLALAVTIVIIALAVGLGVGLTRGGGGDDDGDDGDDSGDNAGDLPDGPTRSEIWQPPVNASWQIILRYPIDLDSSDDLTPDVDIYDLDLFDNDVETFTRLRDMGKKVICYFSAGSWEDWRDDKDDWDKDALGKGLEGWEGERWVDLSNESVRNVMKERIEIAWRKGCDAIDPDNVDGYQNDNGLGLTSQDSVDFVRFLAEEAGKYNMSTGLKNAGDIIEDVLDVVHFSVNEQCVEYSECETFAAFVGAEKPVFHIEYPEDEDAPEEISAQVICSHRGMAAGTEDFSTIIKNMDLDGFAEYCNGQTFDTQTLNSSSSE